VIRAVFFDLDGTLYDRDVLVEKLVEEQFVAFRRELRDIDESSFVRRILDLDDHGHGDKAELYKTVAREWGLRSELSDRLHSHFWSRYTRHCRASEDTCITLQKLRGQGKKLGVITNGTAKWQQQKLESLGIASLFDAVLISETEGVRKPDRAIFDRALDRCGVRSAEAAFIGDNPGADVAGAKAAGLVAIWKYVPYWQMNVEGVVIVRRLTEILPLCLEA
jgi:putative hydrolase of the HAD superfamily